MGEELTPLLSSIQGAEKEKPNAIQAIGIKWRAENEKAPKIEENAAAVRFAFFCLGAGTDVLFNSTVLSVAFWRETFGPSVLAQLGMAQFIPSMVTQAVLVVFAKDTLELNRTMGALLVAYGYMLALTVAILVACVQSYPIPRWLFLMLMGINGACGGLSQSLSSAVAAFYRSNTTAKGASGSHMAGVSFGVIVPVVVNLLALFLLHCSTQGKKARLTCILVYSAALLGVLLPAILMVRYLWGTKTHSSSNEVSQPSNHTV
jgi:hypothetical protein